MGRSGYDSMDGARFLPDPLKTQDLQITGISLNGYMLLYGTA
jgi:hypothetical protein